MHDEEKLRKEVIELGGRYLTRTLGELERLKGWFLELDAGSPLVLKEIERTAHKIHGSGAIFGFQDVSVPAGEIEHIAAHLTGGAAPEHLRKLSEAELRQRMLESLAKLDQAARAAARELGIAPNAH
ncbi:MAG TPA: Hpt domain-containing protein [Steroidobacteraceae bacterium]|mgnify:CR=1 FL=1|jgi:HPt (histidine-containing phosphotransfer) domain-containing protein